MTNTEKPKIPAHRKRKIFRECFGSLLKNHDFQYHRDRFIRFHKSRVLLNVCMELSMNGAAHIRFGAMPLCAEISDISPCFGERIADFGRIYPLPENLDEIPFEDGQFDCQLELFARHLLLPFSEIDDLPSLLHYQERILEDRLSLMPTDWAAWECICLRDYEKALRYAQLYQHLTQESLERYRATGETAIAAADCTRRDRKILQRDFAYWCKCRMHEVYKAQRLVHLLETGVYPLLQENVRRSIEEADSAFDRVYPNYR